MKIVIIAFLLFILSGCNSQEDEQYMYWADHSNNQVERLDQARIKYEIRDGEIWIKKKDSLKVAACCS